MKISNDESINSVTDRVLRHLRILPALTIADLTALEPDLSAATLFRLLKHLQTTGQIVRIRRGVYQCAERYSDADSWTQALQAYPHAVLCLLSALTFHAIGTQSPPDVWLALPKGAWRRPLTYPPVRIVHFSGPAWESGVETHAHPHGALRVYSPAKTVADCFKFRNRIGLDVALEALSDGWRARRFTLDELDVMAGHCRVRTVIRPYVEAMIS